MKTIVGTAVLIKNDTDYEDNYFNNGAGSTSQGEWVAKFPLP